MEPELPINSNKSILTNLTNFINRNKKLLTIILSSILILILIFFLFLEFKKKKNRNI